MLTGQAVYVTAVAQTDVEVLEIPFDRLKEAVTQDQALGDLILRAFILRRNIHARLGAGLRIIGSRYSADARRLRDFASRNRVPYRWDDLEEDPEAEATLRAFGIPPDQTPVVIWKGQAVLRNPSTTELAELLGLRKERRPRDAHDLWWWAPARPVWPPRSTAASEGLSTVVLDAIATGGQAGTSSQIENYLGFPAGISGAELADRAVVQARKFGATFTIPGEATNRSTAADGHFVVGLAEGDARWRPTPWSRHGRALSPPRDPRDGPARGAQRLLRRHGVRGTAVPRRPGHGRRRRELRRARRPVPGPTVAAESTSSSATTTWAGTCPATSPSGRAVATASSLAQLRGVRAHGDEALEEVLLHDLQTDESSPSRRRPCSC